MRYFSASRKLNLLPAAFGFAVCCVIAFSCADHCHAQAVNPTPGLNFQQRQRLAEAAASLLTASELVGASRAFEGLESAQFAFETRQEILGLEHRETVVAMAVLGNIYFTIGHYKDAEAIFELALENGKKVLGPQNASFLASCMSNLAEAHLEMGRSSEAEELLRSALEIKKKVLGLEHSETVLAMYLLGNCLVSQFGEGGEESTKEGMELLYQALAIGQRIQPLDIRFIAKLQAGVALAYMESKEYAKAEQFFRAAVSSYRQSSDSGEVSNLGCLNGFGVCLFFQDKLDEAAEVYHESLSRCEQEKGPDHPDTAHCVNNLAVLYCEQKKFAEAIPLLERQHAIFSKELKPDHPRLKLSKRNLDNALKELKKQQEKESLPIQKAGD